MEKVCGDVDAVVEGESSNLLATAGKMIFSNLWLLCDIGMFCRADFSLDEALKLVRVESKEVTDALEEKVEGFMGALCDHFVRVEVEAGTSRGGSGGASGGGDGDAEEDALAA